MNPSAAEPTVALHAVVAVGYGDDANDRFVLVRNSWGDSWALAGHAWLARTYVESQMLLAIVMSDQGNP